MHSIKNAPSENAPPLPAALVVLFNVMGAGVGLGLSQLATDTVPLLLFTTLPLFFVAAYYERRVLVVSWMVAASSHTVWILSRIGDHPTAIVASAITGAIVGNAIIAAAAHSFANEIRYRYASLNENAKLYATFSGLGQALVDAETAADILDAVGSHLPPEARQASMALFGQKGEQYHTLASYNAPDGPQGTTLSPEAGSHLVDLIQEQAHPHHVYMSSQVTPQTVPDAAIRGYCEAHNTQAFVTVTLFEGGTLHGVLTLGWAQPRSFTSLERRIYKALPHYLTPVLSKLEMRRKASTEAKLRSRIVDNMPSGLVVTDARGGILTANHKFTLMTGFTPEELHARNVFGLHANELEGNLDAVWTQEDVVSYLTHHLHKDGSSFPARLRLTTLRDEEGLPNGLLLSIEDITQQRENEERLSYQASLLANVSDAIIAVNNDMRITSWNKAAERIYGWAEQDVLGQDMLTLLQPSFPGNRTLNDFFDTMQQEGQWTGDIFNRTKSGELITLFASTTVLRDPNGRRKGMVTVNRDISDLREMETALRRTHASSAALIQAMPDYLFRISRKGVFEEVYIPGDRSPTLEEDDMGKRLVEALLTEENGYAEQVRHSIKRAIHSQELQVLNMTFSTAHGERSAEARIVGVDDDSALVIVRDVTERKQAAERERRQREIAEALRDTAASINSTLNLEEALQAVLENLGRVIPHDAANFMIINGDEARIRYARGYGQFGVTPEDLAQVRIDLDNGHAFRKLTTMNRPIIINDTAQDARWAPSEGLFDWIASYMGVNVRLAGTSRGILNIDSQHVGFFDEEDARTLRIFAEQIGVALRNAQLYGQLQQKVGELQNMREMILKITAEIDSDKLLQSIVRSAITMLDADAGGIYLLDPTQDQLVWSVTEGEWLSPLGATLSYGEGFSGHIWATREPLFVRDYEQSPYIIDKFRQGVRRSILGAPILWNNMMLGVLNILIDDIERELTDEQMALVTQFAQHAAVAIHNANMLQETRQNVKQLALLNKLTRLGTTLASPRKLYQSIVDSIGRLIGADSCYLTLYDEHTGIVTPVAASVETPEGEPILPEKQTLTKNALELEHTLVVEQLGDTPYLDASLRAYYPVESALVLPLTLEDEQIGALVLGFDNAHTFILKEVAAAEQAAELIALAIAKTRTYNEMEKRVEQRTAELKAAAEQLRELSRVKDEFVSNVSHELRTPITSIKVYHNLLSRNPGKTERYLEHLDRETERLEYIIEGMLQLSRLDQERLDFYLEETDLAGLLRDYAEDRQTLAHEKDISLMCLIETEQTTATVDRMLLGQAISIILTNALTYTPEGGQVTMHLAREEGRVGIIIEDTGPGINEEDKDLLFVRFYRGQAGRDSGSPGTGLGLSIAQEIIERHNGTIDVHNKRKPAQGTVFSIWLPD